jgi:hypothetical protein
MKSTGMEEENKMLMKEQVKVNSDVNVGKGTGNKMKGSSQIKRIEAQKIVQNEEKTSSGPQNISLVKYDTPFLVSTTISNKKALEELDENNENAEMFLRNLINKKGPDVN